MDPQLLAFQRALDIGDQDAQAAAQRKRSSLLGSLQLDLPDIERQGQRAIRGIGDDFASRGVFSSGIRVQRQNEAGADTLRDMARAQANYAGQSEDLETALARQIAESKRKMAEESLAAQSRTASNVARAALGQI